MLQLVRESIAPRFVPQEPAPAPAWDLDEPHRAIWEAVRPLFPRHAVPTQTDYGYIVISWKLRGVRGGAHHAAPVVIRIEPGLLLALWTCGAQARREIAALQVETVRGALAHYAPESRIPTCDVIVLGDG